MQGFSKITFDQDTGEGTVVACRLCGKTPCFCVHDMAPTSSTVSNDAAYAIIAPPTDRTSSAGRAGPAAASTQTTTADERAARRAARRAVRKAARKAARREAGSSERLPASASATKRPRGKEKKGTLQEKKIEKKRKA